MQLLVFTYHVIKRKNRNHSIKKVTNTGYDRGKIYKQLRQKLGLYWFSFASYSEECFTQIYRALNGDAMFVPLGGAQT